MPVPELNDDLNTKHGKTQTWTGRVVSVVIAIGVLIAMAAVTIGAINLVQHFLVTAPV